MARLLRSVLVCALLPLLLSLSSCSKESPKPEVGHLAPDFSITTLAGATVRLKDLRGKVVFLNLWATWCPPCREEIPSMVRLYEMFRKQGIEILAVSEDQDPTALRMFVAQHRLPYPVALDPGKKIYKLYRATGVPETHLIDRKGTLVASQIGPFDWTAPGVVNAVSSLLRQ